MSLRLSVNKFAVFLTEKDPSRRQSIVCGVWRSREKTFPPFYSALRNPARRFALSGWQNGIEMYRLIARMERRHGSRWLNTDSNVTKEAAKTLLTLAPALQSRRLKFVLPPAGSKAVLSYPGVDVVATPDLLVIGSRHQKPLVGGMRFYWAKESTYALGARGSELVAAMQYLSLVQNAPEGLTPDTSLCLVLECFQKRLTVAPISLEGLNDFFRTGCADFLRYWNALGGQEAA